MQQKVSSKQYTMFRKKANLPLRRKQKRSFKFYGTISGIFFIVFSIIFIYVIIFTTRSGLISPIPKWGKQLVGVGLQKNDVQTIEITLRKYKIPYKMVTKYEEHSYEILLQNGEVVLLSGKKQIEQQISSLQVIVSRLTMEGKQFKKLDLRFDKPVIIVE